jgi:hypothetical protein
MRHAAPAVNDASSLPDAGAGAGGGQGCAALSGSLHLLHTLRRHLPDQRHCAAVLDCLCRSSRNLLRHPTVFSISGSTFRGKRPGAIWRMGERLVWQKTHITTRRAMYEAIDSVGIAAVGVSSTLFTACSDDEPEPTATAVPAPVQAEAGGGLPDDLLAVANARGLTPPTSAPRSRPTCPAARWTSITSLRRAATVGQCHRDRRALDAHPQEHRRLYARSLARLRLRRMGTEACSTAATWTPRSAWATPITRR